MSVKLLKTTTDGAASKWSNEIHLKLDICQLNRISVDTSGLLATWPEFWAIGQNFLGLYFLFCVSIIWPRPLCPPPYRQPDCKIYGFFFIKNLFIEGLAAITAVVDELPRKVNLHNLQVFSDCLCLYCYSHRQYRIRGSFLNFMDFLLK